MFYCSWFSHSDEMFFQRINGQSMNFFTLVVLLFHLVLNSPHQSTLYIFFIRYCYNFSLPTNCNSHLSVSKNICDEGAFTSVFLDGWRSNGKKSSHKQRLSSVLHRFPGSWRSVRDRVRLGVGLGMELGTKGRCLWVTFAVSWPAIAFL